MVKKVLIPVSNDSWKKMRANDAESYSAQLLFRELQLIKNKYKECTMSDISKQYDTIQINAGKTSS